MNVKQAKDFLVEQVAEQAAIEDVPLSDLEKRMMYFTETDGSCENPLQLNEDLRHSTIHQNMKPSFHGSYITRAHG